MKKTYVEPELEITELETTDVLTASGFERSDDETDLINL